MKNKWLNESRTKSQSVVLKGDFFTIIRSWFHLLALSTCVFEFRSKIKDTRNTIIYTALAIIHGVERLAKITLFLYKSKFERDREGEKEKRQIFSKGHF